MKREKICILPKLHDYNGDAHKQWFVYYSFRNSIDGKMVRFRIYDGFTACHTKKAKYEHAEKLVRDYSDLLKSGWDPFKNGETAIYADQLQYAAIARTYYMKRKSNRTFDFYASEYLPSLKGSAIKHTSIIKANIGPLTIGLQIKALNKTILPPSPSL